MILLAYTITQSGAIGFATFFGVLIYWLITSVAGTETKDDD